VNEGKIKGIIEWNKKLKNNPPISDSVGPSS
jgi:hypothetical protein